VSAVRAYRSTILHCRDDPGSGGGAVECFVDGLLLTDAGRVTAIGPAEELLTGLNGSVAVTDLRGKLLIPGLIDCHVHYPQINMIGSYGAQLLDWLERYAYPEEQKFVDSAYAREVAGYFADRLLQNGTTTALVFATVHAQSADAMFEAAQARNMRLITGKVVMDTGCPEVLRDSAASSYADSRALIDKWHGVDRLGYAITPRFALTSSAGQLAAMGKLAGEYPDVHIHTHLAENRDEISAVARRFPQSRSYLDVYQSSGLLRERAMFAHCLHLDDEDRARMAGHSAAAAFCPSSNLFLGSGLFDLAAMDDAGVRTGVGSDVGGGTSLSILRTLADGYKALQLQGQSLPAFRALYLATLGAARALALDDRIGNLAVGKEADFVVLDPEPGSHTAQRVSNAADIAEQLFALITLGGGNDVYATYLLGECAFQR
jgi:guanine deaminase